MWLHLAWVLSMLGWEILGHGDRQGLPLSLRLSEQLTLDARRHQLVRAGLASWICCVKGECKGELSFKMQTP